MLLVAITWRGLVSVGFGLRGLGAGGGLAGTAVAARFGALIGHGRHRSRIRGELRAEQPGQEHQGREAGTVGIAVKQALHDKVKIHAMFQQSKGT